eukprot:8867018-Alexandrium_andersonii.AAC.1
MPDDLHQAISTQHMFCNGWRPRGVLLLWLGDGKAKRSEHFLPARHPGQDKADPQHAALLA